MLDEADVAVNQESLGRGCVEEEEFHFIRMTLLGEVSTMGDFRKDMFGRAVSAAGTRF